MSRNITLSFPHGMSALEAQQKADAGIRKVFTQYQDKLSSHDIRWTGSHADISVGALGQSLNGTLDIDATNAVVTVALPWLLAPLADKIEGFLKNQGQILLEKK
ncbi:polyhydroxyalkanoic acid system family protein [Methylocella sp. CPCC 101449]|jgi:hypothetical protein|uniref:polyhydroxyalkanoic acid system family protein n=1 Tax=Methylocella sp. CPCC 101449 TaxID=2987531 RepID=UPI002890CE67|nr:polyhydroxyalkanoic acid system family protein [Methylocella sp. CPCC 101449]MDT2024285.1 polyhydroxyalkanoic acid system family protein [Methylocella sp. CPCC 101449]HEV2571204.1 polyhydroxyalkanoic acid system family protein [Beijerinckiaceae bacterium]